MIPNISAKVLSSELKELEADGLIIRTMYHEIPPRVEYTLSETGAELATPVVRAIHTFGEQYKDAMRNPPLNCLPHHTRVPPLRPSTGGAGLL